MAIPKYNVGMSKKEEIRLPVSLVVCRPLDEPMDESHRLFEERTIFKLIDSPYSKMEIQACNAVITDADTFVEMRDKRRFVDPSEGKRRYVVIVIDLKAPEKSNNDYPNAAGPGHSGFPHTGHRRHIEEEPDFVYSDLDYAIQFVAIELRKVESLFVLGTMRFMEYALATDRQYVHRVFVPITNVRGWPPINMMQWAEVSLTMINPRTDESHKMDVDNFLIMERFERLQRLYPGICRSLPIDESEDEDDEDYEDRLNACVGRSLASAGDRMEGGHEEGVEAGASENYKQDGKKDIPGEQGKSQNKSKTRKNSKKGKKNKKK